MNIARIMIEQSFKNNAYNIMETLVKNKYTQVNDVVRP